MAEVSHALLMSECYRNSSPRSASTPGPAAPDSPASSTASGRVSTSPSVSNSSVLLSPSIPPAAAAAAAAVNCFGSNYHYSQYANHLNSHPLGLMGTFLSVGSYSPYAALAAAAAAAAAGMSGPMGPQLVPPIHPLTRLRQTVATSLPGPRTLPFSVENILKPEFGRAPAPSASGSAAESDQETCDTKQDGIKHESSSSRADSTPSPSKRFKLDYKKAPSSVDTDTDQSEHGDSRRDNEKEFHQKASSSSSSEGKASRKDAGERGESTELPSDPTKMTDPAKWPAWIFCTRYSDRPSSGPRLRRAKKDRKPDEKRPRTAFTSEQLARLKNEFAENRYLNEKRRQELANELQLHENQIKIWFQNKRAKIKKTTGQKNPLALQLMAQGLYNHSTIPLDGEEDEDYHAQNEQVNSD